MHYLPRNCTVSTKRFSEGLSYNFIVRIAVIALMCLLLAVLGCPRDIPPEALARQGTATHPWELPGYTPDSSLLPSEAESAGADQAPTGEEAIELPAARGPALSTEDTLLEADIPGQWLQVCISAGERLNLPANADMDILDLREDHTMIWQIRQAEQETQFLEGNWAKPGPGQFSLQTTGMDAVPLYGQMFNHDFLFLWSYDQKLGHWFVRLPVSGGERITRNRFATTFGNMIFTEVGDLGFHGVVYGEYERSIGGRYLPGVLTMRWEETQTKSAGYAAFIVDPEFNTLDGVWWLDDYEAAPFGGPWTGTADDSIEMPAVSEPVP